MPRSITITVPDEIYEYLWVLSSSHAVPSGGVTAVLQHLVRSAADGVRRPGSWERQWINQAFGGGYDHHLAIDPDAPHSTVVTTKPSDDEHPKGRLPPPSAS